MEALANSDIDAFVFDDLIVQTGVIEYSIACVACMPLSSLCLQTRIMRSGEVATGLAEIYLGIWHRHKRAQCAGTAFHAPSPAVLMIARRLKLLTRSSLTTKRRVFLNNCKTSGYRKVRRARCFVRSC